MPQTIYQRTPLPDSARFFSGWTGLCLALVIFSPFIGFAWVGKVSHEGLVAGLVFVIFPLLALAVQVYRRWRIWQSLPADLVEEWQKGKIIPPEGAPAYRSPVRFASGPDALDLNEHGILISAPTVLSLNDGSGLVIRSFFYRQAGDHFVPWSDVQEWIVDCDSDGPDFHLLQLRGGGMARIRRFVPFEGGESVILDAVRSLGRIPVRLRCDL